MTQYHQYSIASIPAANARRPAERRRAATKTWLMPWMFCTALGAIAVLMLACAVKAHAADIPEGISANGAKIIAQVHAEGLQIYECKADAAGRTSWQFREPLATLISDGKTVGRHFAGPGWEFVDGSRIKGKLASQAPGASERDIPLLRLDVIEHRGEGALSKVDTVQRLNTQGGVFTGACDKAGVLHLEPYTADYIFLVH
jgi:hypothetical protein